MNKEMSGFQPKYHGYIEELRADGYYYEHEKTGAQLFFIHAEDDNKVFSAGFSTVPTDDTGVAHITEHCVLCGSEKYPLKELFMTLNKMSLNTYLNAMTFPDKTLYPVASQNEQDFMNLIDVYMDGIFHPTMYADELFFRQEGHGFDFENGDEGVPSGVVYNEMKGAMASPDAVLSAKADQALFTNTYKYNSGGDPEAVLDLKYEDFLAFHKKHYHPSNARFYVYGNADIEKLCAFLNERISEFGKAEAVPEPVHLPYTGEPQYVSDTYRTTEDTAVGTMHFVIGSTYEIEKIFAASVLTSYLFEQSASTFKKSLLESGFCTDMFGGVDDTRASANIYLTMFGLKEFDPNKLEQRIFEELRKMDRENLTKALKATLNYYGFNLREFDTGSNPRGMIPMYSILLHTRKSEDPFIRIRFERYLKAVEEMIERGEHVRWIEEFMTENRHRVSVVLTPKPEITYVPEGSDSAPCAAVSCDSAASYGSNASCGSGDSNGSCTSGDANGSDSVGTRRQENPRWEALSEEQKAKEREWYERLRIQQDSPDSEEALAALPKITLADVPKSKEIRDAEEFRFVLDGKKNGSSEHTCKGSGSEHSGGCCSSGHTVNCGKADCKTDGKENEKNACAAGKNEEYQCLFYQLNTGIMYVKLFFPIAFGHVDDMALFSVAINMLGNTDTEKYSLSELGYLVLLNSGGMKCGLEFYREKAYFYVMMKTLPDKLAQNFELAAEILLNTKLSDTKRFAEILSQTYSRIQQDMISSGNRYAVEEILAGYDVEERNCYYSGGLGFFLWLKEKMGVLSDEEELMRLTSHAASMLRSCVVRDGLIFALGGDESSRDCFTQHVETFLFELPCSSESSAKTNQFAGRGSSFDTNSLPWSESSADLLQHGKSAFIIPADIQFVAIGGMKEKLSGSFYVLKNLLGTEYLWPEVRMKGGAYGAGITVNRNGHFVFSSYRDPNLGRTIEAFRLAPDFVKDNTHFLESAILSAVASFDQPISPRKEALDAFDRYFLGIAGDELQEERRQILETTEAEIVEAAEKVKSVLAEGRICVVGNESKIVEEKELFDIIMKM